jgi:CBS domain-containing protein
MKVSEIMTRQVECIEPDTTVRNAAQRMRLLDVGFLPVCNGDRLAGTVTDRDIAIRHVAAGLDPVSSTVKDIMSRHTFYCYEDQDIEQVGQTMREKEVKRILILNRDKRLVGVVSLGDISRAAGEQELAGQTLRSISEAA